MVVPHVKFGRSRLEHTFIGLDVHAVNVVGHALNPATGEISNLAMPADPAMVLEWVRRFAPPVKIVYESGPTGFVLTRYLRSAGINCVVAASSKLLRASGDRIKIGAMPGCWPR